MKCALVLMSLFVAPATLLADELRPVQHRWQLDVRWWNDVFADLPPADDQGFTNDFLVAFGWRHGKTTARVGLFHRTITERYGIRRWDQLDLTGAGLRSWHHRRWSIEATVRAGLTVAGNFGGLAIQDAWHRVSGTGISVDEGLQDTYDGARRGALLVATRVVGAGSFSHARTYAGLDGQLVLGTTGVSRASAIAGVEVDLPIGNHRLMLQLELAGSRYATGDPNLTMRAGYGTGVWQVELRLTLGVRLGRYAFGWQYRGNESGSGEPVGVLWLAVTR